MNDQNRNVQNPNNAEIGTNGNSDFRQKYRPKTGHNRSDFRRCTSQDRFGYKWVIKRSSLVSAHGEVDATNIRNPNCLGMGQILERQNLNLFGFRTLTVYQFNSTK